MLVPKNLIELFGKNFLTLIIFFILIEISKCLKLPKEVTRCFTLTQVAPVLETSTDSSYKLCEWLRLLKEGGVWWWENTSRAVPWVYEGMQEGMLLQSTAASYIHISAISLYNFKFKAIYTHVYSSNIQGNKWTVSILAPNERPNVLRLT